MATSLYDLSVTYGEQMERIGADVGFSIVFSGGQPRPSSWSLSKIPSIQAPGFSALSFSRALGE
jgi:hypothetical protein